MCEVYRSRIGVQIAVLADPSRPALWPSPKRRQTPFPRAHQPGRRTQGGDFRAGRRFCCCLMPLVVGVGVGYLKGATIVPFAALALKSGFGVDADIRPISDNMWGLCCFWKAFVAGSS